MHQNLNEIIEMFDFLENEDNYFAKRLGLKTQYMVLCKYEFMRRIYTNDSKHLIMVMKALKEEDSKEIKYELFLLLSLFILMPRDDSKVSTILTKNRDMLVDYIEKFQNERGKSPQLSINSH